MSACLSLLGPGRTPWHFSVCLNAACCAEAQRQSGLGCPLPGHFRLITDWGTGKSPSLGFLSEPGGALSSLLSCLEFPQGWAETGCL